MTLTLDHLPLCEINHPPCTKRHPLNWTRTENNTNRQGFTYFAVEDAWVSFIVLVWMRAYPFFRRRILGPGPWILNPALDPGSWTQDLG